MTARQRYLSLTDTDLLEEYDWIARERPVSQHEADRHMWAMDVIHGELMRRGLQWS